MSPGAVQRIVAVTGGGGGIGAAIAEELGRQGAFVVTMDPLVTLDGSAPLPAPRQSTAERIVAAGGSARATSVSVTDSEAVQALFEELGRLDAVVNVAGITRPTSFARGSEEDWSAVLSVHLDGYRNVLAAALPIMAEAGQGRILGVTSGSGWRAADAGAYGCAKRAVAALTWQLGRCVPADVVVNAISPIAVTRMVTAALGRAAGKSGPATGGLSLGSMPEPGALGPFGAHLVSEAFAACNGRVLFTAGSEVAVIEEPRLLEVVRTGGVTSVARVLGAVAPALAAAEASQSAGGAGNPRFGAVFEEPAGPPVTGQARTCAVVGDQSRATAALTAALEARSVTCASVPVREAGAGFDAAAAALASAVAGAGPLDAVVVALEGPHPAAGSPEGWARTLAEHDGVADGIRADAGWARAVADHAAAAERPIRLITVTDATTAGGRSRSQASAQLARAGRGASDGRVAAFAVSVEVAQGPSRHPVGDLVAHLVCDPDAAALSGAELAVGSGWIGLRSHPRPGGSITFGGPEVPEWFDATVRSIVGEEER